MSGCRCCCPQLLRPPIYTGLLDRSRNSSEVAACLCDRHSELLIYLNAAGCRLRHPRDKPKRERRGLGLWEHACDCWAAVSVHIHAHASAQESRNRQFAFASYTTWHQSTDTAEHHLACCLRSEAACLVIHSACLAKSSCGSPIKALPDYSDNNYIATSRPCVQGPAHLLVQQASQRGANFRSALFDRPLSIPRKVLYSYPTTIF